MRKRLTVAILALCLAFVGTVREARATLVTTDDSHYGASSLILDTSTNLQWMRYWTVLSSVDWYDDFIGGVVASLAPSGRNHGWTLASSSQVRTLFGHAGLPSSSTGIRDTSGQYTAAMSNFIQTMGGWSSGHLDFAASSSLISDRQPDGRLSMIEAYLYTEGRPAFYEEVYISDELPAWVTPNYVGEMSAWLVRTPVPEPSAFVLFGIGFAGLVAWRKRTP